jgi:SAM-dependent methyltransferase
MPEERNIRDILGTEEIVPESLDDEDEIDPEFYKNGGNIFSEDELGAFGDLTGKRVLHLTFGCSEEGPSLVNMGATVTEAGDDGTTAALAEAAGLAIEFVGEEPAALSAEFCDTRTFDVVYCSYGSMDWIADFESWAEGVAACLVPGGRLVIYDEHPFSYVFAADEQGRLVAANSYFGGLGDDTGGEFDEDEESEGEPDIPEDNTEADDTGWTLGDLIGGLGRKGLAVIDLQEFETSDRYETPLDRLADEVDEDELERVPSALLLIAVKIF